MSNQDKFSIGDKVKWNDAGYWRTFFEDEIGFEDVLTVIGYEDHPSLVELQNDSGFVLQAFDWRFDLVESFQELDASSAQGMPSNQGKTCTQNCVSCKDKETPLLEENDENAWFKHNEFPPAGTVCEVIDEGEWRQTVVVGVDSEGFAVYEDTWSGKPYDGANNPLWFRPIKSPEQIAKQEREAYCDRIYSVLCKAERKNNRSDMAESLYDAGLRFAGEK